MPKGVVKCGNCETCDLFRDGNESLVYSISDAVKVTSDSFKSGFYYVDSMDPLINDDNSFTDASVCIRESGTSWGYVLATHTEFSGNGDIRYYDGNVLINSNDEEPSGNVVGWWQITIDENSGTPLPK